MKKQTLSLLTALLLPACGSEFPTGSYTGNLALSDNPNACTTDPNSRFVCCPSSFSPTVDLTKSGDSYLINGGQSAINNGSIVWNSNTTLPVTEGGIFSANIVITGHFTMDQNFNISSQTTQKTIPTGDGLGGTLDCDYTGKYTPPK